MLMQEFMHYNSSRGRERWKEKKEKTKSLFFVREGSKNEQNAKYSLPFSCARSSLFRLLGGAALLLQNKERKENFLGYQSLFFSLEGVVYFFVLEEGMEVVIVPNASNAQRTKERHMGRRKDSERKGLRRKEKKRMEGVRPRIRAAQGCKYKNERMC